MSNSCVRALRLQKISLFIKPRKFNKASATLVSPDDSTRIPLLNEASVFLTRPSRFNKYSVIQRSFHCLTSLSLIKQSTHIKQAIQI